MALAQAIVQSGSALEARYWRQRLGARLDRALSARSNQHVETALNALLEQHAPGYEALVELAEAHSESLQLAGDEHPWDALLISAPVLAWTRYQLPSGHLHAAQHRALIELLKQTVLHPLARLSVWPSLIRFDGLPQSFQETRSWTLALAQHALGLRRSQRSLHTGEVPDDLLADAYFLVGVVAVPHEGPLFRWQDEASPESHAAIAHEWARGCETILGAHFTGCQLEYLQPDAFYASTRQADQHIRPLSLKAAVTWLQTAAHIEPKDLRATLVACGEHGIEEYRIGFCTQQSNDVIYGCVWPSLGRDEPSAEGEGETGEEAWGGIVDLLRELGVTDVRRLPGLQPMEFCDDCGTPFFPDVLGDLQHPEMPEEVSLQPVHFH